MPAQDNFGVLQPPVDGPITTAVAVVPDNDTDLAFVTRAVFLGVGGDLAVVMLGGAGPVTFTNMAAGWHPIRVARILAAGTTADAIMAGW